MTGVADTGVEERWPSRRVADGGEGVLVLGFNRWGRGRARAVSYNMESHN